MNTQDHYEYDPGERQRERELEQERYRMPPEHIVMTDECFEAVKRHDGELPEPRRMGFGALAWLYGIPVEHYPTEAECELRAAELAKLKIRVLVVSIDPFGRHSQILFCDPMGDTT